jgi:hypothetical protein
LSKEGDELFGRRIMGIKTAITPAISLICLRSLFKEKGEIYGRNKLEGL